MRMTNRIMENNSLYNINNNKILQDKLSTQMSTTKKLTRPSDDPVTAIRFTRVKRETGVSPVRSRHCEKGVRSSRKIATDVKSIGKVMAG